MPTPAIPKRYTIVTIVVLMLIVAFLVKTQAKTELILQPKPLIHVNLVTLQKQVIQITRRVTGRLQPARKARLHFETTGTVNARFIVPGNAVKQNDTLLTIGNYDANDSLIEAKSQLNLEYSKIAMDKALLQLARQQVALQNKQVARQQRLNKASLAAGADVDQAQQQLATMKKDIALLQQKTTTSKHRLALKQAAVSRAQRNIERTRLLAPYDSMVNIVHVNVGDYVSPNDTVVELVDVSSLDLLLEVNHRIIHDLRIGQLVAVWLGDEKTVGKIFSIQMDAKQDTHTHPIKIRIAGEQRLPGTVATAELLLEERNMLVVPLSAVLNQYGDNFVFQYDDGRVRKISVQTGVRQGLWREIKSGLTVGDRIISHGLARLSDHQRVQPTQLEPER